MKILHLADLHFDADFSTSNPNLKAFVKKEKIKILDRIHAYIEENKIELVILAGDIYDADNPKARLVYAFNDFLRRVLDLNIHVVLANGNHDFWLEDSHFGILTKYSKFHRILHERPYEIEIKIGEKDLVIHGYGYSTRNPSKRAINNYRAKNDDKFHIGISHGVIDGRYEASKIPYYPMSKSEMQSLNYDYFAMGHVHRELDITNRCMYSGGLYPRYYGDYASYGGIFVQIGEYGIINTDRIKFSKSEIKEIEFESSAETRKELLEECFEALYSGGFSLNSDYIYNIIIKGKVFFDWNIEAEKWLLNEIFDDEIVLHNIDFKAIVKMKKESEIEISKALKSELIKDYDYLVDNLANDDFNLKILRSKEKLLEDLKNNRKVVLSKVYEYIKRG